MNNDQEQDRGEFAPAPTVFNDLTSLKYKQTVGPIESAMRERVMTDSNRRKYITTEPFKPDYNTEAVLVEEMQRMAQRTWVGLAWEEIDECFKITPDQYLPAQIYKCIEAKLRSKNT